MSPERTPRKPSRKASQTSQGSVYAQAALAATLHPVITIDARGIIHSASDSIERVFGWTADEIVGRNVSVLMPEPHRSNHDSYLERYIRTGVTNILNTTRRFDAVRKDGSLFPIDLSVSRADMPNRWGPLFVGIIRDMSVARSSAQDPAPLDDASRITLQQLVTEQTAALEAAHLRLRMADRLASIGTLAAGLGHDINNVLLPVRARLNAISAACDAMPAPGERSKPTSRVVPRDTREHVNAIRVSIDYLQKLAQGLHYLAQDPEKAPDRDEPTDLGAWWSQAGPVVAKAVPGHVKVTASISAGLPSVLVAPHRLTQAVLNLVVNAGEAIPLTVADPSRKRRQGRVRVWAESASDGRTVRLGVTDNGIGMPPDVTRRAFELFFTTKSRGNGTGLGLPLVHKVAMRAGGRVEIESQVGKGTTVTLTLPANSSSPLARGAFQAAQRELTAVVTVADGRTAALICHVLDASRIASTRRDTPGNADLWIADEDFRVLQRVSAWRRDKGAPSSDQESYCHLILLSPAPTGPLQAEFLADVTVAAGGLMSVTMIEGTDYEAIRAAIAQAMSEH